MMAGIRGKNTRPELIVRKYLHARGYRYRLHESKLPGSPDITMSRRKIAIFVHGCFWHRHIGCKYAPIPKTKTEFWLEKFEKNRNRDENAYSDLLGLGWRVVVVWECALKRSTTNSLCELERFIHSDDRFRDISWRQ